MSSNWLEFFLWNKILRGEGGIDHAGFHRGCQFRNCDGSGMDNEYS